MSMKRTILINDVKYSNQAKIVLGMTKMTQVTTKKMVTVRLVNKLLSVPVHCTRDVVYEVAAKHPPLLVGVANSREAALGKSPPAQNWMRMLKKAASEATMEVHPTSELIIGHA